MQKHKPITINIFGLLKHTWIHPILHHLYIFHCWDMDWVNNYLVAGMRSSCRQVGQMHEHQQMMSHWWKFLMECHSWPKCLNMTIHKSVFLSNVINMLLLFVYHDWPEFSVKLWNLPFKHSSIPIITMFSSKCFSN